ncbi:MAG: type I restriction-modification enzyme R subunit C-terminal domain-containing protein, partial [Acidobacteriota bacterium]
FDVWLAEQESRGTAFTDEQCWWLEQMFDYAAANYEIAREDFEYPPFAQRGGYAGARKAFGERLTGILDELMEVVAA